MAVLAPNQVTVTTPGGPYEDTVEASDKIEKLESQLRELEITNRMFERFNAKLLHDEVRMRQDLEDKSYVIGALEADRRQFFARSGGDPGALKMPLPPPRDRAEQQQSIQISAIHEEHAGQDDEGSNPHKLPEQEWPA